jgi:SDR family mycofactocin-dependent oxidoreductase
VAGSLEGTVAFITGAARGQGRAHAVKLASEGADIIALDVCQQIHGIDYPMSTPDDLDETVRLVEKLGRQIIPAQADVRDRKAVALALDNGISELGRLDFVIANAGVMPTCGPTSNEELAWQLCLDVLLTGTLNTIESAYEHLAEGGRGGSIVIIGSMAAVQPMMRTEKAHTLGLLGYSAAKAALVNLGRNYASILAAHQVRVNIVHPTAVNTLMCHNEVLNQYWKEADPEDLKVLNSALPDVLEVEPEDIADAVLWLCSSASKYFTGNEVRIDAGANLR